MYFTTAALLVAVLDKETSLLDSYTGGSSGGASANPYAPQGNEGGAGMEGGTGVEKQPQYDMPPSADL